MTRNGYKVKIAASNCHWRFPLQAQSGSRFCCVICPSKKADTGSQTDATDDMARLRFRIDRDVTIEIGTMRNKNAQPVALDVFMKWMETTMDIRGPSYPPHIIKTENGDLILDRRFQGKIYLKERFFLLPGPGRSSSVTISQRGSSVGIDRVWLTNVKKPTLCGAYGSLPFESTRRPCSQSISISFETFLKRPMFSQPTSCWKSPRGNLYGSIC
jgi:hypothetical protein